MVQGDLFGNSVRVVEGSDGEPWFVAKDVCDILGIEWHRNALATLDADEKRGVLVHTLGGDQEVSSVSESGLYTLILRSRKPEAKAFKRWITREVLPSIRKTGLYSGDRSGLPSVELTTADYMALRGMEGSVCGFGRTAVAVCHHSGVEFTRRRKRGHKFPVSVLDHAAHGKTAARGPLSERQEVVSFFYDKAKEIAS